MSYDGKRVKIKSSEVYPEAVGVIGNAKLRVWPQSGPTNPKTGQWVAGIRRTYEVLAENQRDVAKADGKVFLEDDLELLNN